MLYNLRIEVSQPLRAEGDECEDYPTLAWAASAAAKRELEKAVLSCLRRLEQDVTDCEVMDFSVEEES